MLPLYTERTYLSMYIHDKVELVILLLEEKKTLELFLFCPQLIPTTIIVVGAGYSRCKISD